jgi:hypothetical protein
MLPEEELRRLKVEKAHRLQFQVWQQYPLLWLEERFGEKPEDFEWTLREEYADHKWDGSPDPLAQMWRSIAEKYWAGVESCTGSGKTFCLSRILFWFLDVYRDSLVVTSAPKEAQLTLNLWAEISKAFYKFKKIRPKAALYKLRLVVEDDENTVFDPNNPNLSKSWQAVGFVAGVSGEEESATRAQGFHRKDMLIITEETPGMSNAVMTAFMNTCTAENNQILAVGNPDSELDLLHEFCGYQRVQNFRISAYDYPNFVIGKEVIPGAVTRTSVNSMEDRYGSKEHSMYKSRVRGISPAQSADSIIQLAWLEQATSGANVAEEGFNAVGVDVANSESGDKAALAWGKGNELCELQDFYCKNATHLAYNLMYEEEELREQNFLDYHTSKLSSYDIMDGMVGIDSVGVGVACLNAFLDKGMNPQALYGGEWKEVVPLEDYIEPATGKLKSRPMYKFANLRTQMFWELREDLRKGLIRITITDKDTLKLLYKELISIKAEFKGNAIAIESKENIKKRLNGKSPNLADAVAYWNWTRKGYRLYGTYLPIIGGRI